LQGWNILTLKSNYKSRITVLLTFNALLLLFSTCGNPIIENMIEEYVSQPEGVVFNTDVSEGFTDRLTAYINEKAKDHTRYSPLPIKFTGTQYRVIGEALANDDGLDGYSYLYLDMREMTQGTIPGNCFNASEISSKCKIVAVKLSPKVTTIEESAFSGNTMLLTISMPGVNVIGEKAFYRSYFLQEVFMAEANPTTTGPEAFYGIMIDSPFIIHLPKSVSGSEIESYYIWSDAHLPKNITVSFSADMP
jgi:hypothetical protein